MSSVRRFLDVSTAALPPGAAAGPSWLTGQPGVIAHPTVYGWWLWVPDDVDSALADHEDEPHPTVVALWRRARELSCDYVLIDADGPIDTSLAVHHW